MVGTYAVKIGASFCLFAKGVTMNMAYVQLLGLGAFYSFTRLSKSYVLPSNREDR